MVDDPSTINEMAGAVQEVAKTTGKAIDASQQFGAFISKFVSGPLEQGIGIFEDRLRFMRWERQIRLMQRVSKYLKDMGEDSPSKPVPLKFAVPLFQAASLEDDDYLQDKWAKLLVNSSVQSRCFDLNRSYIDILERLSHIEARILDCIYSLPEDELMNKSIITAELPDSAAIDKEDDAGEHVNPPEDVLLALANLARLGCISLPTSWDGGQIFSTVYPTVLGRAFVQACTLDFQGALS